MSGIKTARSRHQYGFTLVELLIAMTLVGILSLALFGGLRFGAQSWETVRITSGQRDRVILAQNFLRGTLGEVSTPGSHTQSLLADARRIEGGTDRLTFIAPWLARLSKGSLFEFTLWHDPEGDGALRIRWHPVGPTVVGAPELRGERTLLTGVDTLRLGYLSDTPEGEEASWSDAWPSDAPAPRLVRIAVLTNDTGQSWPDLVIALHR